MSRPLSYTVAALLIALLWTLVPPHDDKAKTTHKTSGAGHALDMWSMARTYPYGELRAEVLTRAWRMRQALDPGSDQERSVWRPLGPQNFAGRMLCITPIPGHPRLLYAGAASGGLWKSSNGGQNWAYIRTGKPVLGVSSVAVHPQHPDTLLIGTGEVYGDYAPTNGPNQGTGQGYGLRRKRGTYGIGILKSRDGGSTWSHSLNWSSGPLRGVNRIRFALSAPDTVYAATSDGLYRSGNGGNTWTRILNIAHVSDVLVHPPACSLADCGLWQFWQYGKWHLPQYQWQYF